MTTMVMWVPDVDKSACIKVRNVGLKNIPEEDAVERLVQLIKRTGLG